MSAPDHVYKGYIHGFENPLLYVRPCFESLNLLWRSLSLVLAVLALLQVATIWNSFALR